MTHRGVLGRVRRTRSRWPGSTPTCRASRGRCSSSTSASGTYTSRSAAPPAARARPGVPRGECDGPADRAARINAEADFVDAVAAGGCPRLGASGRPRFEHYVNPYAYAAALRLWEAARGRVGYRGVQDRPRFRAVPAGDQRRCGRGRAGAADAMGGLLRVPPGSRLPRFDEPRRWWSPGEGPTPADYSAVVNGPRDLREAVERAPRGSRARREALARWRTAVEAEARRQLGE